MNKLSANSHKSTVFDCSLIYLPKIETEHGNITALNNNIEVPFDIKRVYYLFDIPSGEERGAHSHKNLYQLIVAANGSFDVMIDDGKNKRVFHLNRPYYGLLLVPGLWRELINFSGGSISLVLASEEYDEADYLRNYDDFLAWKQH